MSIDTLKNGKTPLAACGAGLLLAAAFASADTFCDLVVTACPKDFAGKVITVPKNTVALSARMPICKETVSIPVPEVKPPDIVFIIDNSTSMSSGGGGFGGAGGSDPNEERFKQAILMIDSLFARVPQAHVAITAFSRRLQFDDRDPHWLKPAFPGSADHDAYVPLTRLDTVFANGVRGIDTLKAMLKYSDNGDMLYTTQQPPTRTGGGGAGGGNIRNGTDITLGFQSAVEALKASTTNKDAQFFIFISDGEPSTVDDSRQAMINDFKLGVGAPTTFTIFFGNDQSEGFAATTEMTNNIKVNGYSTKNPQSAIWNTTDPGANLQTLLQGLVKDVITVPAPTSAQTATITKGTQTLSSNQLVDSNFVFQKRLSLETDLTSFTFNVLYSYTDNSVAPPTTKTETFTYPLTVQRSGQAVPPGATTVCHEGPIVELTANNKVIPTVTADNNPVGIRITQAAGQTCAGCTANLSSVQGSDRLTVPLTPAANISTGSFNRTASADAIPTDAILQHYAINDSIVVVLVNPEIPLETVRQAFAYKDVSTVLDVGYHNEVALTDGSDQSLPPGTQFLLAGAPNLQTVSVGGMTNCCASSGGDFSGSGADSSRYVGIILSATREFSAEFRIFDNLGTLVNETKFQLPKAEYLKLPYDPVTKTRKVRFLWNGLTKDGAKVGTGAYILLGKLDLAIEPGVAEDRVSTRITRRIGVIRNRQ